MRLHFGKHVETFSGDFDGNQSGIGEEEQLKYIYTTYRHDQDAIYEVFLENCFHWRQDFREHGWDGSGTLN